MSTLDPIARHDFMATVMTAAAEDGVSVLLSSPVPAQQSLGLDEKTLPTDFGDQPGQGQKNGPTRGFGGLAGRFGDAGP
jgi:hypothetical protein